MRAKSSPPAPTESERTSPRLYGKRGGERTLQNTLKRQVFTISRELEYFTEAELTTQTGYPRELWFPEVVTKELIDNSLDACEQDGVPPVITIDLVAQHVAVGDNGPGIRASVLKRILDYSTRTGNKQAYISPTRGAQGNALKTILAIPYVLAGNKHATTIIESLGVRHEIRVGTDAIAQRPRIEHEQAKIIKNRGTCIRVPGDSACLNGHNESLGILQKLVLDYSLFNPHAAFILNGEKFEATDPAWQKWLPNYPTSPHWYSVEQLGFLVAAKIAAGKGKPVTVREFVSEFRGLSSTARQANVTVRAGLGRAYLNELASDGRVDFDALRRLLGAMKQESRPVKPEGLGVLGEAHFRRRISGDAESTFRYSRQKGVDADGLPYLVECAFAVVDKASPLRGLHQGQNWSVPLGEALQQADFTIEEETVGGLAAILWRSQINIHGDPICLALHIACPRFRFLDRGKGSVSLTGAAADAVARAVSKVIKPWSAIKKQEDREHRQAAARLREYYEAVKPRRVTIKEAAFEEIPTAYAKASGEGRLPAHARQVMYACRREIQEKTGRPVDDQYFCYTLLPEYVRDHPEETKDWDVVYDERGHLEEPHSGRMIGIGTQSVRSYLGGLPDRNGEPADGPGYHYGGVLYLEKEGFADLLEAARIPQRYDLAVASSKGMNSTAVRDLLVGLSGRVKILVLHDFDQAGLAILGTLQRDTPRYQFESVPEIIDLGLRLDDVQKWELQSEAVFYQSNPEANLRLNGATDEEVRFLFQGRVDGHLAGQRVELNAFTSEEFIAWLEEKLKQAGVAKVLYRAERMPRLVVKLQQRLWQKINDERAVVLARFNQEHAKEIMAVETKFARQSASLKVPVPKDLHRRVAAHLKRNREILWTAALAEVERTEK
jgi:DNA topoisomerase VI subunit B